MYELWWEKQFGDKLWGWREIGRPYIDEEIGTRFLSAYAHNRGFIALNNLSMCRRPLPHSMVIYGDHNYYHILYGTAASSTWPIQSVGITPLLFASPPLLPSVDCGVQADRLLCRQFEGNRCTDDDGHGKSIANGRTKSMCALSKREREKSSNEWP